MSLLRALTSVQQLVMFQVHSKIAVSFGMIKRLFGFSTRQESIMLDIDNIAGRRFMIVGLGNFPHPDTRHSVGMKALDDYTDRLGLTWESVQGRKGGLLCKTEMNFFNHDETKSDGKLTQIYLFKPKSLMNICGGNVARTAKSLGVMSDAIYLIHDELDMGLGKVSIKNGGSANGHRGVLSCIADLKSNGLWPKDGSTDGIILPRLRIGIGRPTSKSQVIPFVLGPFLDEEVKVIQTTLDRGMDLLMRHISHRVKTVADLEGKRTDIT